MSTHLTEDDLVLHYYGEMTGADESADDGAPVGVRDCHESYRRLQRVLAAVDERARRGPELPEHFERTVWARLEPDLRARRRGWLSWFVLSPAGSRGSPGVVAARRRGVHGRAARRRDRTGAGDGGAAVGRGRSASGFCWWISAITSSARRWCSSSS